MQNTAVGVPPSTPWSIKIIDLVNGNVVGDFTLPANGNGVVPFPSLGITGGHYLVNETMKFGYTSNILVNGTLLDQNMAIVNLAAGDVVNVAFINTADSFAQPGFTFGSLKETPPSDLTFPFGINKPIPVQSSWPIDKNTVADGKLDLVVNKTMAVLINVTDTTIVQSSTLTVRVTFDGVQYSDVTTTGSAVSRLIAIYPIVPKNLGDKTLTGTYQVGAAAPVTLTSTTVTVRDTVVLKLYFAYFTPPQVGKYAVVTPANFAAVVDNITKLINATYPVKQLIVNVNYNAVTGNVTAASMGGAKNDMKYLASIAKRPASGLGTDAIGVAIVPDSYFTYHGYPAGVVGAMVTPSVKACVVSESWFAGAAHEVAHVLYSVFYSKEYYSNPSLKGKVVSGVWAEKGEWRTGWDIMDYVGPPDSNWIGNKYTYTYLFKNSTKAIADPEILFASGTLQKDGTINLQEWYRVTQGTPDTIIPGEYSLRFVDANGNEIATTYFTATFSMEGLFGLLPGQDLGDPNAGDFSTDTADFAFATVIPPGTVTIKVMNMTQDPLHPNGVELASVNAGDLQILKPQSVSITFAANGLGSDTVSAPVLIIDGTSYTYSQLSSLSFNWAPASTHAVTVLTHVTAGTEKRYDFTGWTNGDGLTSGTSTYTVPSTDATVTVNYKTQYKLTVQTDPPGLSPAPTVTPTSADGYYDSNTAVTLTANTVTGYTFNRWYIDNIAQPQTSQIQITMNLEHNGIAYYTQLQQTMNAYFTDSNYEPINSFDVLFTKDTSTTLKLTATHPSTYYYTLGIKNNGPAVPLFAVTIKIPTDFVLTGTDKVTVDFNPASYTLAGGMLTVNIPNVASGQAFTLRVHLDYNLKGTKPYPANSPTTYTKQYTFETSVGGLSRQTTISATGKKATAIGGIVTDTRNHPENGLKVKVYQGSTMKWSIVVDGDGFYLVEVTAGGPYTIRIVNSNDILVWTKTGVTVAANTYVPRDFTVLPIDWSIQGFVRDDSNAPVAGVTVQLIGPAGNIFGTTTTNLGGHYVFRYYLPAQYTIKIIVPPGYTAAMPSQNVRVHLSEDLIVNFDIRKI